MSTATSIHIGLNRVDPGHYGSEERLNGCINDANAMFRLASSRGFTNQLLLTDEQATSTAIFNFLRDAASELKGGDTLLVTFAGHGSQVRDLNNDDDSSNDQTWCAYDRMIVDDELAQIWSLFQAGVRIILVSDSCHSEGVARLLTLASEPSARGASRGPSTSGALVGEQLGGNRITGYRVLPLETARLVDTHHRELYASIQRDTLGTEKVDIKATVITLSACRNEQTAADGESNGLYTSNLLAVWNEGNFRGTYKELQDAIGGRIAHRQDPQTKFDGAPNSAFTGGQPFMASSAAITAVDETAAYDDPNTCRLEVIMPYAVIDQCTDQQLWGLMETNGPVMLGALRTARKSSQANRDVAARMMYRLGQGGAVSSERWIRF